MNRGTAFAISTLVVVSLMTGCSGKSVDSACDVQGITDEVAHMVEESALSLDSLDSLACSGDWAVAEVSIGGGGTGSERNTFILHNAGSGWILKAPEIACIGDIRNTIPDDLVELACGTA